VLRSFIDETSLAKAGTHPKELPESVRQAAEPPIEPPADLIANAKNLGITLDRARWNSLDDDERYALIKLGSGPKMSHNLELALRELVVRDRSESAAHPNGPQIMCARQPGNNGE
jgi:Conserved nitrate reductase-associated protein (Nitr_red_assoc)